jgi:hypothetical protein
MKANSSKLRRGAGATQTDLEPAASSIMESGPAPRIKQLDSLADLLWG